MRIVKLSLCAVVILAVASFALADVIGPGEKNRPPHRPFTIEKLDVVIENALPSGTVLVFDDHRSDKFKVLSECATKTPCELSFTKDGDLYLLKKEALSEKYDVNKLTKAKKIFLIRALRLYSWAHIPPSRITCHLDKKGTSYELACKP